MTSLLRQGALCDGLLAIRCLPAHASSRRQFSSCLGNAVRLSSGLLLRPRFSPEIQQITLRAATFASRTVSDKQQMVGVRTKMKTHSGAKKRFSLTGTGLIKFKRAHKYHKMYHKSMKQKKRLLKYGYLKKGQARRVLTLLPYKLGRAKRRQKLALARKLNRMEIEARLVRRALQKRYSPEAFSSTSVGTKLTLPQQEVDIPPDMMARAVEPTDAFFDPHERSYAGPEQITLPIKTDPISIEKMVLRARAHQKMIDRALRKPGERRHRWRPLRIQGAVFPPPYTPPVEVARQQAQKEAFLQAQKMREERTREKLLRRHQSKLLRDRMIAESS